MSIRGPLALLLAVASSVSELPSQSAPTVEPIVERVEVHRVLVDAIVLDRSHGTVPGLTAADFDLLVDHRPVEIASLDVACVGEPLPDPRAGDAGVTDRALAAPSEPTSYVHVFDYFHLESPWEAIEQARIALRRPTAPGERHMVLALADALRLELAPTTDRDAIDAALARMAEDPTLWARSLQPLTEHGYYRRLIALVEHLDALPGRKSVLLWSGPIAPDGFDHDPESVEIAALAARSRVAFYPVDAGGLRPPKGWKRGDLGGPKRLARLALETGGRATWHTNDLGLALARARRDAACRYTLGFRDPDPVEDRERRLAIFVRRRGVRVVHPVAYVLRSERERRDALEAVDYITGSAADAGD